MQAAPNEGKIKKLKERFPNLSDEDISYILSVANDNSSAQPATSYDRQPSFLGLEGLTETEKILLSGGFGASRPLTPLEFVLISDHLEQRKDEIE